MLRVTTELLSFLRYRREMDEAKMQGPTFAKSGDVNSIQIIGSRGASSIVIPERC